MVDPSDIRAVLESAASHSADDIGHKCLSETSRYFVSPKIVYGMAP